jgi:vancomycin resistance protein VanW
VTLAPGIRSVVRRRVPFEVRQLYAETRRRCRDAARGATFARETGGGDWPVYAELEQTVRPGQLSENKLANLGRGTASIDRSVVRPDGQWSFWKQVGRPSAANGYVEGRTIVEGRLVCQVGGGLCQLSGLLYHLALVGGLEIVERHAHSIDIYREHERYTPLGADATVVWGFKDLRVRNPFASPVSITCSLDGMRLVGQLRSPEAVPALEVSFVREQLAPARVRVETLVGGSRRGVTEYEQRPGLCVQ